MNALLPGWDLDADGVLTLPCPTPLVGSARAYLAGTASAPVVPRLAATVILLRSEPDREAEVFLLRRHSRMAFAPGMVVFPGGSTDPRDAEEIPWAGPDAVAWASRLGLPPEQARTVVVAAVRELFEESGILLAGPDETTVVTGLDTPDWAWEAARLAEHEISLADVLIRRGLVLRTDLLTLRGHWLTPEFEPRRYDTYFFAALLPEGQTAASDTTEADAERWARPRAVLDSARRGELGLFPPTAHTLGTLASYESAQEFVREQIAVERHMLVPIDRPDGGVDLTCRLPAPTASGRRETTREKEEVQ